MKRRPSEEQKCMKYRGARCFCCFTFMGFRLIVTNALSSFEAILLSALENLIVTGIRWYTNQGSARYSHTSCATLPFHPCMQQLHALKLSPQAFRFSTTGTPSG